MRKKLIAKVNIIEDLKNEIINNFNTLSENQLNFKPGENKWNLLQVVEHLTLAETESLNYVNKKILDPSTLLAANLGSKFRFWLLKTTFSLPIKIKNRPTMVTPTNSPDYKNVLLRWDIVRSALQQLIDEQSDKILEKLIYKHPVAGRLTAYQMVYFFEDHIKHHQKQIKRIKKHRNYPSA